MKKNPRMIALTPKTKKSPSLLLTPLQIPQKNPEKSPRQLNLFLTNHKPSLKVSYDELSAFREWKFIDQTGWEA